MSRILKQRNDYNHRPVGGDPRSVQENANNTLPDSHANIAHSISGFRRTLRNLLTGSAALGIARIIYLAAIGMSFLIAAQIGEPSTIGTYALSVSLGAIATVVVQMGIDRALLVEISQGADLSKQSLTAWMRWRMPSIIVAAVCLVSTLAINQLVASIIFTIITRVLLLDLESIVIASSRTGIATVETIANAAITGPALVLAARNTAANLVWAASIGNVVALAILGVAVTRLARREACRAKSNSCRLQLHWSQCLPFAGMAAAGAAYQRADLAVIGALGGGITVIGSYAVATRVFDALVAFRGAVVQHNATRLNRKDRHWKTVSTSKSALRMCGATFTVSILLLFIVARCSTSGLLENYPDVWLYIALIFAGIPMMASHTLTSSMIYASPGSRATLLLSVVLALLSICITATSMATLGVAAVAFSLSLKEYVSFLTFSRRFKAELANASIAYYICWPVASAVLIGVVILHAALLGGNHVL